MPAEILLATFATFPVKPVTTIVLPKFTLAVIGVDDGSSEPHVSMTLKLAVAVPPTLPVVAWIQNNEPELRAKIAEAESK